MAATKVAFVRTPPSISERIYNNQATESFESTRHREGAAKSCAYQTKGETEIKRLGCCTYMSQKQMHVPRYLTCSKSAARSEMKQKDTAYDVLPTEKRQEKTLALPASSLYPPPFYSVSIIVSPVSHKITACSPELDINMGMHLNGEVPLTPLRLNSGLA